MQFAIDRTFAIESLAAGSLARLRIASWLGPFRLKRRRSILALGGHRQVSGPD
jgi:hypothetical protein